MTNTAMKNTLYSFLFLLLIAPAALAQANDWGAVESLQARTRVVIETKSGSTLKGRISSVSASSVNFERGGRAVSIDRSDVSRVYLTKRGSAWKRAFWGAAIGLGVGVALGVASEASSGDGDGLAGLAGVLYGAPAGAAIGAATTGRKRGQLIYYSQ